MRLARRFYNSNFEVYAWLRAPPLLGLAESSSLWELRDHRGGCLSTRARFKHGTDEFPGALREPGGCLGYPRARRARIKP